ncbi:ejaculatory bulb-specific protein 3-like isoform X2 [Chrysoperla carnea]|uniref:ejaculatory bulb-specific protein 3-like isoform X2 n=1 Tax=Chrysoperla carnea TaxID=189513 RepID=UPI001D065D4B|nr:ejaculatory bulb-specific protein 3-like isoform X2 [Chrysoperla carnea]
MKYAVVFAIVALATIVYALPKPDDDKYTTKYDNIDIDSILSNERLLKNYIDCIQNKGKLHLKDAIQNCCEKCSDKQKEGVMKVFKVFSEKKPEVMKQLQEEHDPTGEYEKLCREKYPDVKIF